MLYLCLTAEQSLQRAESLSERFDMFGGGEPAGDQIIEETVVFTYRLQGKEEMVCCHGTMLYLQNPFKINILT